MSLETEVKVRVSKEDLPRIRARLEQLGGRCVSRHQKEQNQLFDFADGRLKNAGCALRLRSYGDEARLTFKGKVQEDPSFKKREEHETLVEDANATRQVLHGLGLQIWFDCSKFREIYELTFNRERVSVCLDETPVGLFIEIESSEEAITSVAQALGFEPASFIRKSYIDLYSERR